MEKTSDLRQLSEDELQDKLDALKKNLMQVRFQASLGKLERQASHKETKRDIARVLTVINEKKSEVAS